MKNVLLTYVVIISILQVVVINAQPPSSEPFSLATAYKHLTYSYSAYCDTDQLLNWTCPYCSYNNYSTPVQVTSLLQYDPTNTFGFLGFSPDDQTIILAFRGTEGTSLENWITNLNFPKTEPYPGKFPGALVHSGFYQAYNHVKAQVESGLQNVTKLCPTCTKFIITGHSLGGALAILAATDIYDSGLSTLPVEIYTFGAPRVGNVAFVEYFETTVIQSVWRLVNNRDIVPHLPPMDLNFYHLPVEVWFNSTADPLQYVICDPTGEDPNCSDSLLVALNIPEHLDYLNIDKSQC
eukprot:gene8237-10125_t